MTMSAMDFVAEARQQVSETDHAGVESLMNDACVILDVREPAEFEAGHLPGAVNIPRGVLEFRIAQHPATADAAGAYLVYCKNGGRSVLACQTLQRMGYDKVRSVSGGFDAWAEAGRPVQTDPAIY